MDYYLIAENRNIKCICAFVVRTSLHYSEPLSQRIHRENVVTTVGCNPVAFTRPTEERWVSRNNSCNVSSNSCAVYPSYAVYHTPRSLDNRHQPSSRVCKLPLSSCWTAVFAAQFYETFIVGCRLRRPSISDGDASEYLQQNVKLAPPWHRTFAATVFTAHSWHDTGSWLQRRVQVFEQRTDPSLSGVQGHGPLWNMSGDKRETI